MFISFTAKVLSQHGPDDEVITYVSEIDLGF
jgi:hypothetical protein